ncbi:MAG: hypothetical protein ACJ74B_13850 [Gaiellaceae bacterium]
MRTISTQRFAPATSRWTRLNARSLSSSTRTVSAAALTAAAGFLLARTLPDIAGKPWHEDEAVAGLISARPLGDVLHTVVVDRGGAPLHFLLAHSAFALDGSPGTLRWLSLLFAIGTIPLCYDLARRVGGEFAGVVAAALTATSQLLMVYATFGRMYSLFAFSSALSLSLFVRGRFVAALLPLLVHPFGVFLFAAEAAVALWTRRIRALPVVVIGVALAVPYLRLGGRYDPDAGTSAPEAALRALGGSAGGYGIGLALFGALAVVGALSLPRTHASFGVLVILLPTAALAALARDDLSPRHLIFVLPIWVTLVAAGIARLPARTLVAAAAIVAAALAPSAIADPRVGPERVEAPAAWLRAHVQRGDVLYPYSPVFLAALPDVSVAKALPREPLALRRALARTNDIRRTFVAIPQRVPDNDHVAGGHVFRDWLILEHPGPFATLPAYLARVAPRVHDPTAHAAVLQLRGAACDC